jgi:hypothetical protein
MPRRLLARLRPAPPPPCPTDAAARLLARLVALRALPEAAGASALRLSHRPGDPPRTVLLADGLQIGSAGHVRLLRHPRTRALLQEVGALPYPLCLLQSPAGDAWFLPAAGAARLRPGPAPGAPSPGARLLDAGTWTLVAGRPSAHQRLAGHASLADVLPDLASLALPGAAGEPIALAAVADGRAALLVRILPSSTSLADGVLLGPFALR